MSKWGYVTKNTAKQKFESDPDDACDMVAEMAATVIDQQKDIDERKKEVRDFQTQRIADLAVIGDLQRQIGHLEGYRDRVHETDNQKTEATSTGPFTIIPAS